MLTIPFQSLEDYVSRRFSILDQLEVVETELKERLSPQQDFSPSALLAAMPFDQLSVYHLLKELMAGTTSYHNGNSGVEAKAGKENGTYLFELTLDLSQSDIDPALSFLSDIYNQHITGQKAAWLLAKDPTQLESRRRVSMADGQGISALVKVPPSASGFQPRDLNPNYDTFHSPNGMGSIQRYCEEYVQHFRKTIIHSPQGTASLELVVGRGLTTISQRIYHLTVQLHDGQAQNLVAVAQKADILIKTG